VMGWATEPAFVGGARKGTRSESEDEGKSEAEAAAVRKACMCGGTWREVLTPMPLGEEALVWELGLVGVYEEALLAVRCGTPAWPGGLRREVECRCGFAAPGALLKCWYRPCGAANWFASQC